MITTTFLVTTLGLVIGSMTFGVIVGALGGAALATLLGRRG